MRVKGQVVGRFAGFYGTQTGTGASLGREVSTTALWPKRQSSRATTEASAMERPGSTPVMRTAVRVPSGTLARDPCARARAKARGVMLCPGPTPVSSEKRAGRWTWSSSTGDPRAETLPTATTSVAELGMTGSWAAVPLIGRRRDPSASTSTTSASGARAAITPGSTPSTRFLEILALPATTEGFPPAPAKATTSPAEMPSAPCSFKKSPCPRKLPLYNSSHITSGATFGALCHIGYYRFVVGWARIVGREAAGITGRGAGVTRTKARRPHSPKKGEPGWKGGKGSWSSAGRYGRAQIPRTGAS